MGNIFNFFSKRKLLILFFIVILAESLTLSLLYFSPKAEILNSKQKKEELKEETTVKPEASVPSPAQTETQKESQSVPKSQSANNNTASGTSSSGSSSSGSGSSPETLSSFVAFYADSQSDTDGEDQNHQRVVNYIMNSGVSTVFHAGDLLEDGTPESLARFNSVTSGMRSSKGFYSAQGNNERNSAVYFNNFNYPGNEHWYSVNIGNLHMVILDNYASSVSVGSEQYNWLVADLQSAAAQSRITGVIFHYPIYGANGDTKGMIGSMVPLFKNYGVEFVVSGHEHSYQKRNVDGIYYFVMSGQPSIGYMTAAVYNSKATLSVYNSGNSKTDTITVNKR